MRPLLPFLISFIFGIIAASRVHFSYRVVYLSLAASVITVLFLSVRGIRFNRYAASIPFFFLGALSILPYVRPSWAPGHIKSYVEAASFKDDGNEPSSGALGMDVEGVVIEALPALSFTRLTVEARLIRGETGSYDTHGRVLLTLSGREDGIRRGDTVRFLSRLKVPSNFGNPGEYDYAGMLGQKGIYVTGFVKSVRLLAKVRGGEAVRLSPVARLFMAFDNARARVRLFIEGTGAIYAEPLKALIIGESRGIDHGTKAAFIATGTAHVLAISGLHVGMVAWFSYSFFIFLLKRSVRLMLAYDIKRIAVILMLFPVILYGLLAGFPVSTERAVIMAAAFAVTLLLNRGKDLYNVLALSAFAILLTAPHALWDVSFQLTFAAVLAILYIAPKLAGLMPGEKKDPFEEKGVRSWLRAALRRRIIPAITVTIAASAGTYPIIAYHFHMASLTGLAANLIVVPLTGVAVPLLLLSAVTLPVSEGLATVFVRLSDAAFGVMATVVKLFAALPWSSVQVTTPTPLEIILFYLLIITLVNAGKGRLYQYAAAIIILFIIFDWGWWGYQAQWSKDLKVTFISIGQGESSLVEFPGGKTMLIDGGGLYGGGFDTGERVIAPLLLYKKIKGLDYMVLSHSQRDHMAGLGYIAENFSVKEFWWNGRGELGELKDALTRRGAAVKTLDGGSLKETVNGVEVEFLHPLKEMEYDANNMSLVLRLRYGHDSFLFSGDIGEEAERALIRRDVGSTVLKVPHHGSRGSSTEGFLEKARPKVAVISAGRGNVFGFPHRETLERYRDIGAEVYRTDENGAVTVTSGGEGIRVNTYLTGALP